MELNALFNIGYGLYVASTEFEGKDNACIVNTVMQLTSGEPCKIGVAINKNNYTAELLQKSKRLNISILTQNAPFEVYKQFGFQSGRSIDKFDGISGIKRANNGVLYLSENVNSVISAYVQQEIDLGTHMLFIATITDAKVLSKDPSVTYAYYHQNVKPKPQKTEKHGWRCKICGYIYEGEELPPDFICPWCKHGVADFEKI